MSAWRSVVTVLITAPWDVLGPRLAARGRTSDGPLSDRMNRGATPPDKLKPDVIINNVGEPETGARKLVDTVYATGVLAG